MAHKYAVGPSSTFRATVSELLDLAQRRPAWHASAACRGQGTEVFFPEKAELDKMAAARAVCAGCTVRAECAAAGREGHEIGVWGGTSGNERRRATRRSDSPKRNGSMGMSAAQRARMAAVLGLAPDDTAA